MNNLEITDIITLEDDKEYVITSIAYYNDEYYYYIVDINDIKNIKICKLVNYQNNYKLLEIEDDAQLAVIIPILYENIKNEVKS